MFSLSFIWMQLLNVCLSGTLQFSHLLEVCQHVVFVLCSFNSNCFHLCEKSVLLLPNVILSHINNYSLLCPLCCLFCKNIIHFIVGYFLIFRWSDVVRTDPISNSLGPGFSPDCLVSYLLCILRELLNVALLISSSQRNNFY